MFGPGPPVFNDHFNCEGDEAGLSNCEKSINKDFSSSECESAGVICSRAFGKHELACISSCKGIIKLM